ncbi:hypothetical protein ACFPH6_37590 [Streptomyces xiangluensis]|uniref:Uncharacterized protein n=1 Tax=Streptomyces xiangluensis TaxID=2665720 RepID=A0ABV8YY37_9ACTN
MSPPHSRGRAEDAGFAVGALFLTPFFLLLGGSDDRDTTASSSVKPGNSAPDVTEETDGTGPSSAPPSATTPTASATPSPSASRSPSPSPTVKQATAQEPAALSPKLVSALAAQSGNMAADLYRDANGDAAEIEKKIQQGETGKAAEKARDLTQRLNDAQQKGKWGGDAQIMQLLSQLAASG